MKQSRTLEMLVSVVFCSFFAGVGIGTNTGIPTQGWVSWFMTIVMTVFALLAAFVVWLIAGEEE